MRHRLPQADFARLHELVPPEHVPELVGIIGRLAEALARGTLAGLAARLGCIRPDRTIYPAPECGAGHVEKTAPADAGRQEDRP
jgi:hypothetical protein